MTTTQLETTLPDVSAVLDELRARELVAGADIERLEQIEKEQILAREDVIKIRGRRKEDLQFFVLCQRSLTTVAGERDAALERVAVVERTNHDLVAKLAKLELELERLRG